MTHKYPPRKNKNKGTFSSAYVQRQENKVLLIKDEAHFFINCTEKKQNPDTVPFLMNLRAFNAPLFANIISHYCHDGEDGNN